MFPLSIYTAHAGISGTLIVMGKQKGRSLFAVVLLHGSGIEVDPIVQTTELLCYYFIIIIVIISQSIGALHNPWRQWH